MVLREAGDMKIVWESHQCEKMSARACSYCIALVIAFNHFMVTKRNRLLSTVSLRNETLQRHADKSAV